MNTNKTLYGLMAFAPLIMVIPVMVLMFSFMAEVMDHPARYSNGQMPTQFGMMMVFALISGTVGLLCMIMYLMHAIKNPHIPYNSRTMWIILIVLAGTVGMIVYYFTWIRKEDQLNARHGVQDQWK